MEKLETVRTLPLWWLPYGGDVASLDEPTLHSRVLLNGQKKDTVALGRTGHSRRLDDSSSMRFSVARARADDRCSSQIEQDDCLISRSPLRHLHERKLVKRHFEHARQAQGEDYRISSCRSHQNSI